MRCVSLACSIYHLLLDRTRIYKSYHYFSIVVVTVSWHLICYSRSFFLGWWCNKQQVTESEAEGALGWNTALFLRKVGMWLFLSRSMVYLLNILPSLVGQGFFFILSSIASWMSSSWTLISWWILSLQVTGEDLSHCWGVIKFPEKDHLLTLCIIYLLLHLHMYMVCVHIFIIL